MDKMTMRVRDDRRDTCRLTSRPFRPGIIRSRTKTSGCSRSTILTVSRPSYASPTRRKSVTVFKRARKPWRTIWWSSASNRVKGMTPPFLGPHDRELGYDARSRAVLGINHQVPAQKGRTFPHAAQAARIGAVAYRAGIEAQSVVFHEHKQQVLV